MGILLEADYKNVLTGKESIVSGLQKAFGAGQDQGNPLEHEIGSEIPRQNAQLTYEAMNRDSGKKVRS